MAASAAPAVAQVAVEASIQTDYRVRGYSMSDGDPAGSLSLSYDDASGFYLGGTAVGILHDGEPEFGGFQANAGYAVKLNPDVSFDAGISQSQYYYAYGSRHLDYTELYMGVAVSHLSARINYSPNYFRAHSQTIYAELQGGIEPAKNWFLSAHGGVFRYLDPPPYGVSRQRYDWQVGLTRQFGATGIHLDVSGRVQEQSSLYSTDSTAVVLSLTHAF